MAHVQNPFDLLTGGGGAGGASDGGSKNRRNRKKKQQQSQGDDQQQQQQQQQQPQQPQQQHKQEPEVVQPAPTEPQPPTAAAAASIGQQADAASPAASSAPSAAPSAAKKKKGKGAKARQPRWGDEEEEPANGAVAAPEISSKPAEKAAAPAVTPSSPPAAGTEIPLIKDPKAYETGGLMPAEWGAETAREEAWQQGGKNKGGKQAKSAGAATGAAPAARGGNAGAAAAPAPGAGGAISAEAAALEAAAEACGRDAEARVRQWHDWTVRAQQLPAPGASTAWKEIFLRSRALEKTVESCITLPLYPHHLPHLQALLSVSLGHQEAAQVISQVASDLSQVLSEEGAALGLTGGSAGKGAAGGDVRAAAAKALAAAVTAVKLGGSGWAVERIAAQLGDAGVSSKLQEMQAKAASMEHQLQLIAAGGAAAAAAVGGTAAAEEGGAAARGVRLSQLVNITESRINLLLSTLQSPAPSPAESSSPAAAEAAAAAAQALQSVRDLTAEIVRRKKLQSPAPSPAESSSPAAAQALQSVRDLTAEIVRRKKLPPALSSAAQGKAGKLVTTAVAGVGGGGEAGAAAAAGGSAGGGPAEGEGVWETQGGGGKGGKKGGKKGAGDKGKAAPAAAGAGAAAGAAAVEEARRKLEEAAGESSKLRGQVEAAEAEASRLRSLWLDAEARRKQLEEVLAAASAAAAGGGAKSPAAAAQNGVPAPVAPVAAVQPDQQQGQQQGQEGQQLTPEQLHQLRCAQQLGVVHALESVLQRPHMPLPGHAGGPFSGAPDREAAVMAVVGQAVENHLSALSALLHAKLDQLKSAGERLQFSQEKLQKMKAEKDALRGKPQLAAALARPLQAIEQMHKTRVNEVQSVMAEAEALEAALQKPQLRSAVALLPPMPSVNDFLQQIGVTLHQVHQEYAAIQAGAAFESTQKHSLPSPPLRLFPGAPRVHQEYAAIQAGAAFESTQKHSLPSLPPLPRCTKNMRPFRQCYGTGGNDERSSLTRIVMEWGRVLLSGGGIYGERGEVGKVRTGIR
ncbi:unnamed protein product [Closterium sp. Naga37s-1]|nr:unnamed protein product [Closterium sp. Naga37s-1]